MAAMNYNGKVALITGAGAGIGRLYALTLGQRGAKIVVNDMNKEAADAVHYCFIHSSPRFAIIQIQHRAGGR